MRLIVTILRRIKSIFPFLRNKDVAFWKKLLVIGGLVYFVMPIEVLPDFMLPIGFVDDTIILATILVGLGEDFDKVYENSKKSKVYGQDGQNFAGKYKKNSKIEDVDFEVKED